MILAHAILDALRMPGLKHIPPCPECPGYRESEEEMSEAHVHHRMSKHADDGWCSGIHIRQGTSPNESCPACLAREEALRAADALADLGYHSVCAYPETVNGCGKCAGCNIRSGAQAYRAAREKC